jgi:hypothetical protein
MRSAPSHQAHQDVSGDSGVFQGGIPRGFPHLLVAAFVAVARFVASVCFEKTPLEMVERGSLNGLDDEFAQVWNAYVPNHRAEALDDGNDGQRSHHRLLDSVSQQQFRLGGVRVLGRHQAGGDFQERRAVIRQSGLPGLDGGGAA